MIVDIVKIAMLVVLAVAVLPYQMFLPSVASYVSSTTHSS